METCHHHRERAWPLQHSRYLSFGLQRGHPTSILEASTSASPRQEYAPVAGCSRDVQGSQASLRYLVGRKPTGSVQRARPRLLCERPATRATTGTSSGAITTAASHSTTCSAISTTPSSNSSRASDHLLRVHSHFRLPLLNAGSSGKRTLQR